MEVGSSRRLEEILATGTVHTVEMEVHHDVWKSIEEVWNNAIETLTPCLFLRRVTAVNKDTTWNYVLWRAFWWASGSFWSREKNRYSYQDLSLLWTWAVLCSAVGWKKEVKLNDSVVNDLCFMVICFMILSWILANLNVAKNGVDVYQELLSCLCECTGSDWGMVSFICSRLYDFWICG